MVEFLNRVKQRISHLAGGGRRQRQKGSVFHRPYPALMTLLNYFGATGSGADVLYLGDSVVERIAREDEDLRTLGSMVKDILAPKFNVAVLSHSAYQPRIYYHLATVLQVLPKKPRCVLLPINMRCFSPQWDRNPAWQFEQEETIMKAYRSHPERGVGVLSPYEPSKEAYERFDALEVHYPLSPFTYIGQFRLLIRSHPETEVQRRFRMEQIFIFHYTYPLSEAHPKLVYLQKLIDLLQQMEIQPILYVTPINFQGGVRYVGDAFLSTYQSNIATLRRSLKPWLERGVPFEDFSLMFSSDFFFHRDLATEHLNQVGRWQLAQRLATYVRSSSRGGNQ